MRCALIEFNEYHEEVLPTFVWLLNRLGIEPDVYMTAASAKRRPFALLDELRCRRRRVERIDRRWGLPYRLKRYDVAIINSMEPPENLDRAAGAARAILGVVHNTNLLLDDPAYRLFFEQRFRLPIVMARHIADHVRPSLGELPWVSHVVFGEPPVARSGDTATFVVSGNVEYNRRNYASLLDAVGVLQAEGAAVKVRIVGRSNVRDGKPFRAEAERRGLASCFEYSPSDTNHPDFYRLVAESDFSLPLIDTADPLYGQYLRTKLASSVVFAIGLGVPIVAHTELARVYAIDGGGPTYEDGGLADAMRTAIASTGSERAAWREALERQREAILDASLQNLRTAIEAVTRRRAAT